MQSIVSSAPQSLIDSLDFSLPNTAAGVESRIQTTFAPAGGSQYNPSTGTRVIRFHLTGETMWLDGNSCRVQFDIRNLVADKAMHYATLVPSCIFSRCLIRAGGQIVEDMTDYNRLCHMMQMLVNPHALQDMESEGLGNGNIPVSGVRRVSFKLLSGILSQSKYLPLKLISGLTIELTLADANDWCQSESTHSQQYQLENVEMAADLVSLDPSLEGQFYSHVLNQQLLPITYSTHIVTSQAITGPNFSINLSRAVSRLQSIFFSFEHAGKQTNLIKRCTDLYHPANGSFDVAQEMSFQVKIGARRFPLYPVKGFGAQHQKLSQAVGISSSTCFSLSMTPTEYRGGKTSAGAEGGKFVAGIDLEKVPLSFTGLDLRAGDLITIDVKSCGDADPSHANGHPSGITVILYNEQILNVRDNAVDIID